MEKLKVSDGWMDGWMNFWMDDDDPSSPSQSLIHLIELCALHIHRQTDRLQSLFLKPLFFYPPKKP
jgi:hypothetical protein